MFRTTYPNKVFDYMPEGLWAGGVLRWGRGKLPGRVWGPCRPGSFPLPCPRCGARGVIFQPNPVGVRPGDDSVRDGAKGTRRKKGKPEFAAPEAKAPAHDPPHRFHG